MEDAAEIERGAIRVQPEHHPLIDEAMVQVPSVKETMEELAIAEACEPTEDYESEQGIRLFFERLHNGWRVDVAGRMRPPKNLNITPDSGSSKADQ